LQAAGATGTTVQPGDNLVGGAGTDVLNIAVAGSGGAYTLAAVQTSGIERILLSQFDTDGTNSTTIDSALMTGVSTVGFSASAAEGDTIFSNFGYKVGAEMRNGAGDLSLTYTSSVLSGSDDTQNLTVSALTAGTFTANGAETIAITSETAKSTLTNVASDTLKTVTVAGGAELVVSTALTATTVNAGSSTGGVSVKLGSANQAVTGGSGNDTIDAQTNLTSADTINAGTGTDTLKLSVGNATINVGTSASKEELFNVSGFEIIDVASTNDAATLDLDSTTGVTTVVAAANVKTYQVTAVANSTAISFTLNGVAHTTDATDGNATAAEAAALINAKINTISGFSSTVTTDTVTITATTGEAIEISAPTGGATAATVSAYSDVSFTNLAAGQAVDIYSADAVTASLKDASGSADALSINLKTLTADRGFNHSIGTLTANNIETITMDVTGMSDGKIKTVGALTGNAVKTLNITGNSDLTISAFTGSTALTTIDGSTASGDLSLAAAPAAKDQSIKTGSGNDTIAMAGFLTAADTIDGGANNVPAGGTSTGKDLLTATGNIGTVNTQSALKIANVENIEVAIGAAAATYIDAAGITGAENLAFSNDTNGGTVKITNLAQATKIGLGIGAVELGETATVTLDVTLADATGSSDSLSLDYSDSINADNSVTLKVASAVETLNISAGKDTGSNTTQTLVNTDMAAKNIVITDGAAGDTLALGTLNAATTSITASTYAGILTLTTAATGAVTVSSGAAVADSITTGAGADTITLVGNLGTTVHTVNGGTGNDILNATADAANTDFTSVSNVETINLTIGGNKQVTVIDGTKDNGINAATTVNILGGDSLSSFTMGTNGVLDDDAAGTTMTLDASTFGGAIDILVASDAFDAELTIKAGALTTDKVTTTIAAQDNKIALMSGVESLVVQSTNNDVAASIDLSNVTGLTTVTANFINVNNKDQIQIDKLAAGVAVKTTITDTGDNLVVNLASVAGATDTLSLEVVEFSDTGATDELLDFDAAGIETLNLSMKNANTGRVDLGGVTATTGSFVTVNVSGTGVAELKSLSSTINNVVSSGTGALTIAAADRANTAMTITGGEGADSIAMENSADVLNGGLGTTDTLVVSLSAVLGGIQVDLSSTTDQVTTFNGASNATAQIGFENVNLSAYTGFGAVVTGSTGANTIVGTGSADQITGGNGADTITGGGGNDAIDLAETTAAVDRVVYGSTAAANGEDTVTGFIAGVGGDVLSFNSFVTITGTLEGAGAAGSGALAKTTAGAAAGGTDIAGTVFIWGGTLTDLGALIVTATTNNKLFLANTAKAVVLVGDPTDGAQTYSAYYITGGGGDAETVTLVGTIAVNDGDAVDVANILVP
jgi:hypothetical protein